MSILSKIESLLRIIFTWDVLTGIKLYHRKIMSFLSEVFTMEPQVRPRKTPNQTDQCCNCCKNRCNFFCKVFTWELKNQVKPSAAETLSLRKLVDLGKIRNVDDTKQCYLSWRRANLAFMLPIALCSAIWNIKAFIISRRNFVAGAEDHLNFYTMRGFILTNLKVFYPSGVVLATFYCLFYWGYLEHTRRILRWCWIATICATFAPIFFKPEQIADIKFEVYYLNATIPANAGITVEDEVKIATSIAKIQLAMAYTESVLLLIPSLALGSISGCLVIRGLIPQSTLTTWILLMLAPFTSILFIAIFVFLLTISGDRFLVGAAFSLILGPWLYIYYGKRILKENNQVLVRVNHFFHFMKITGLVLVIKSLLNLFAKSFAVFGYYHPITNLVKMSLSLIDSVDWISLFAYTLRLVLTSTTNGFYSKIVSADIFYQIVKADMKMANRDDRAAEDRVDDSPDQVDHLHAMVDSIDDSEVSEVHGYEMHPLYKRYT